MKILKEADKYGDPYAADDDHEVEPISKGSEAILNLIKEKLKKKSYNNREELTQDVVALFKKWQQKL